MLNRDKHR